MFLNALCAFAESETVRLHSSLSAGLRSGFSTPGTHTKAVPSGRDGAAVMLYCRSYVVSSSAFSSPVFGGRPPSTSEGRKRRSCSSGLCCYTKPPVTYHHPPTPPLRQRRTLYIVSEAVSHFPEARERMQST